MCRDSTWALTGLIPGFESQRTIALADERTHRLSSAFHKPEIEAQANEGLMRYLVRTYNVQPHRSIGIYTYLKSSAGHPADPPAPSLIHLMSTHAIGGVGVNAHLLAVVSGDQLSKAVTRIDDVWANLLPSI
jgi:hypothetical protein